jgi:flagellar protein FliO/FliZ
MDGISYSHIAFAFGGLLVLLGLFYYLARFLSGQTRLGKWRNGQRIGVVEIAPVDGSRRLVLVRRDNLEHLLLLSGEGDLVVESGIPAAEPSEPRSSGRSVESAGWPTLRMPGRGPDRN